MASGMGEGRGRPVGGDGRATTGDVALVVAVAGMVSLATWRSTGDPVAVGRELAHWYLAAVAYLVAHEGAHAAVAWAAGLALSDASIGRGRLLATLRIGVVPWRLRALPSAGYVRMLAYGRPWKRIATLLAGPLVPLPLALLSGDGVLLAIAVAGLLDLVPWAPESDGSRILRVLRAMGARRRSGAGRRPHATDAGA